MSTKEKQIYEDTVNAREGRGLQHFPSEKSLKAAREREMFDRAGAGKPKPFRERQEYRDWHYQRGIYDPD